MIVLLVVAGAWLGLLLLVLGTLHVATATPTPRPGSPAALAVVGDAQTTAAELEPSTEAPRRAVGVPTQAA